MAVLLQTGMTVLEVDLFSGYAADGGALGNLLAEDDALKRFDVLDGKVVFYVDGLTVEDRCFSFRAYRKFEVRRSVGLLRLCCGAP